MASALGDLISATKNASGKPAQDPSMSTLKDSAKVGLSCPDSARACDVGGGFAFCCLAHAFSLNHTAPVNVASLGFRLKFHLMEFSYFFHKML